MRALSGLIFILACCWFSAVSAQDKPITVCADADPPPWTYWKLDGEGKKTREVIGSSVELVTAAFALIGKTVVFSGELPWKRCLYEVEEQTIDFAMDAYFDTERAKTFDYSVHYNTLTPQIFYLKSTPVSITSVNDLKKYRGCGINGFSYVHYGLSLRDLDLGAGHDSLYRKLHAKRCDYFVEELEVIAGYNLIGKHYLDDADIAHGPVPGASAPAKYLLTAKNGRNSGLLKQLNLAIVELIRSGKAEEAWNRHAAGLAFKP